MEEKSLIKKLERFLDDEARSYSMDFGCITALYIYRMWGGIVPFEEIEEGLPIIKKNSLNNQVLV